MPDGTVHRSVFAVRVSRPPGRTTSSVLRTWDRDGQERELGIVRHLDSWSLDQPEACSRGTGPPLLPAADHAESKTSSWSAATCSSACSTDQGPAQFTMRWTQSQAQDFGARGKVLLDVEDNRFLVPDVDELPQRERELLQRYVYW